MWIVTTFERFDELMDAEHYRQRRQREVTAAAPPIAVGVAADRGDQRSANDVSLRGEAHISPAAR
jgi:hypothetical protein